MNSNNRLVTILSIVSVLLVIAGCVLSYALFRSEERKEEVEELMALEREEMLNDLATAQVQYDELMVRINNDSLRIKLEQEQLRTQQLLEELERTKTTSAAEITRLKKELKTIRAVLKNYVMQIDSLNRENANLKQENTAVREKYNEASRQIDNLSEEKKILTEKVTLASQLDASNVRMTLIKKNGKSTEKLKRAKQIEVRFTINKNITAETGEKIAYIRILQPDQEPLVKSQGNTFQYENRSIGYSIKRNFEFTGEEQNLTLFWNIEETLQKGKYSVYIFVDGNMIGSGSAIFD